MPAGDRLRVIPLMACALLIAEAPPAQGLLIDGFSTPQAVAAVDPATTAGTQVDGPMLGGERDIDVTRIGGFGVSAGTSSDQLVYDHIVDGQGFARVSWDGADDDATLDATGLGGIDLTEGGAADSFALGILLSDQDALLSMTVYTSALDFSTISALIPDGIPPQPSELVMLHFADFSVAGGSGADFANVGAIELVIDGGRNAPLSLAIDELRTVLAPEPSSLGLLMLGLVGASATRRAEGDRRCRY